MFRCIPLFRGCNRQVEYIDKRHCSLSTVPDDVLRYPRTLEELLLDSNHIRDLPKGLFRLIKLRRLSLSDNEIGRLPPDVASLVNLVELDVSKNDIPDIPENIKFLKSLQNADISGNPLTKLPAGFVQLRNLMVLCLNDVSLSQLPSDFGNLQNLQSLELRENILRGLPPSFALLTSLERLDLGCNEITELPSLIGQLVSLQELWLDCNELYTLPLEIEKLKKLTCLDVSENRLEYLPEEVGGLESLTDLHLSQNCLESLPEGIGKLSKLTIFKVDQNRLLSLTPEIGNCESLQELILTENLLSDIPNSIGRLVNLTNLNIDRNRLSELPSQIGNLVRLGVLSLRENRLNFLPEETGKLKELHVLDVSGNRLQYLPITVTALNLKALWLAENQSQPMLKFQTDVNERTGAKVLTCFLLPQQEYHPESMENLLRDSIEQDSRLSWDQQKGDRTSSVKFVEENEDDREDKETQFVRHDTPHPRELKARHNKLLISKTKNIDGHVATHDEKENEVLDSFRPQRSSITSVTSSSSETSGTQFKDAVQSLADIPDSDDPQEAHLTEDDTTLVSCASEVPLYRAQTREDLLDDDEESDQSDKDIQKHVGFNTDGEDQPERHNKLHRRDTPHHLKNKRINLVDSQKDQEKVLAILAQEAKKDSSDDSTSQHSMPSSQISALSESDRVDSLFTNDTSAVDSPESQLEIIIQKTTSGLGLSIAGGVGSTPYVGNDEGIFVSKIIPNGPAETSGLKVGDKILMVKGKSLVGATHYDAVDTLKTAGNELVMIVKRDAATIDALKAQGHIVDTQPNVAVATPSEQPLTNTSVPLVNASVPLVNASVPLVQTQVPLAKTPVLLASSPVPMSTACVSLSTSSVPQATSAPQHMQLATTSLHLQPAVVSEQHNDQQKTMSSPPTSASLTIQIQVKSETVHNAMLKLPMGSNSDTMRKLTNSEPIMTSRTVPLVNNKSEAIIVSSNGPSQSPSTPPTNIEPVYKSKKPENLVITVPQENKEVRNEITGSNEVKKDVSSEFEVQYEILHTTLIRDSNGLGLSIVGNPCGGEYGDGVEGIYITKIAEVGAAFTDGKLKVGDKVLTINGIDMEGARQDQAVSLLSGLERFVRLVVQRQKLVPRDPNAPDRSLTSTLLAQKSPKLIGLPRPYTQRFYSSSSYMANRPSYMGGYRRPEISPAATDNKTFSLYTKLPGLRNDPADVPSANNSFSTTFKLTLANNAANSKQDGVPDSKQDNVPNSKQEIVPNSMQDIVLNSKQDFLANSVDHKEQNSSAYAEMNCMNHVDHAVNVEEIFLVKAGGPLGLSIIGGVDHTCHPFGAEEPGIFISKIVPGGAASKTGKLKVGDRLLKVNGAEISNATHQNAVMALLVPTYEMSLTVRHDPLPKGWQEIIVTKHANEKLGMGIQGGVGGHSGNPYNKDDEGIFIAWVNSDGAAGADGRILPGMRIVEVNETSLLGATYQEAITALRTICDRVRLVVCDGYNVSPMGDGIKSCVSSSSIDREDELTQVFRQEQEVMKETALWEQEELQKLEMLRKEKSTEMNSPSPVLEAELVEDNFAPSVDVQTHGLAFSTPIKTMMTSSEDEYDSMFTPNIDISEVSTTDESILDPIAKSKLPGAKTRPPKPPKPHNIPDPEQLTFSEKKRKFELVGKPTVDGVTSDLKQFSFFSPEELERMREEEEKKLSSMTEDEIKDYHSVDMEEDLAELCDDIVDGHNMLSKSPTPKLSQSISKIPVRTVKAEQRQLQMEFPTELPDNDLTPAQQRALQAAKRAAWRQARLKSLEADAFKAQMVIAKACEMSRSKSSASSDDAGCASFDGGESVNSISPIQEDKDLQNVIYENVSFVEPENTGEPSENGTCIDDQEDADVSVQELNAIPTKMSSKKRRRRSKK